MSAADSGTVEASERTDWTAEPPEGLGGRVLKCTAALVAAALPLLGACEGNGLGPDGSGSVRVQLRQADGLASAAVASVSGSGPDMAEGNVDMDAVGAVNVTLSRVEVHRTGNGTSTNATSTDDGTSGWVSLELAESTNGTSTNATSTGGVVVDLTELPSSGDGITVAAGDLEAGTYQNIRLFFEKAEIVLTESVTLGSDSGQGGRTFEAGTYELFVPSGKQTGIKVPTAGFTVDSETGETVTVLSDTDATIQNINVTGQGLLMTPVLTAETESGSEGGS